MGAYLWAWLVVAVLACLTVFSLRRATRDLRFADGWRDFSWLLATWLVVPAPVPGFPGHYAPAFLVFLFESLFQRPGKPHAAGLILAASTLLALVLVLVLRVLRRRASEA